LATHYYVAASLPMLVDASQEPPLSSEEFLERCRRFMTDDEYLGLAHSSLDPDGPPAPGICQAYRAWERSLRNDLARRRSEAQGLDPGDFLREVEPIFGTEDVAAGAMAADTPLTAELYLDGHRWSKIDELATGRFFDTEFLRAYRLKLQILERRALFDEERGFAAYRDIYSRVLEASGGQSI